MAYFEGEVPVMTTGNCNNGGMWGQDGIWAILLLALLGGGFGYGRGGFGGYGAGASATGEGAFGYQLGKLATTNDVASGFSTSEIMSDLNDIILGQNTGFANVQQTLCQGFNGINTSILQSANATERGFATLGYNLANCCCDLKGAISEVRFANERQTCDIIQAINLSNQRVIDYMTSEKIDTLNRKLAVAEGQISQYAQTNAIVSALKQPCPVPAYTVPNPNCCYNVCNGTTI